jgi:GNAT superfamily N-acetyltransferase
MPAEIFVIRSARPEDLDALLGLYRYLHADDDPLPERTQLDTVWRSLQDNPGVRYFVAEIAGRIVSTCNLSVVPNLTRGARPFGIIENVVTHADYRRRGLATALLRHALRTAWAFGCYKVMLMTGRRDLATLRFYEQAGFKPGVKTAFIATPEEDPMHGAWEW